MRDIYEVLFYGGMILGIIFLILAIVLFFSLRIPKSVSELTGRAEKKAIKAYRDEETKKKSTALRNESISLDTDKMRILEETKHGMSVDTSDEHKKSANNHALAIDEYQSDVDPDTTTVLSTHAKECMQVKLDSDVSETAEEEEATEVLTAVETAEDEEATEVLAVAETSEDEEATEVLTAAETAEDEEATEVLTAAETAEDEELTTLLIKSKTEDTRAHNQDTGVMDLQKYGVRVYCNVVITHTKESLR